MTDRPGEGAPHEGVPKQRFHEAYEGQAPWDIGRPQPDLTAIADRVRGSVLDVGCGTGEHALFFAARGHDAWGVDMVPIAIERARVKAAERGLEATFRVEDALALERLGRRFDHIVDSGLFHVFGDDLRPRFVESLARAIHPGGSYHVLCFSELTPGTEGPRRVTQAELRESFRDGWIVREIVAATYHSTFPDPQPRAWRATIARAGGG
jgi:cyclopropane fatty-acyl-phospholipid synthase-like methyltransferase